MMKVNRGCHNTKNFNKLQICKNFFTARVFGSTAEYAATAITVAKTQTYAVSDIGDVQLLKV